MEEERLNKLRWYLSSKVATLLDAAHELDRMGQELSGWAQEMTGPPQTSGETRTSEASFADLVEQSAALGWGMFIGLQEPGSPPATAPSTKASPSAAGQCLCWGHRPAGWACPIHGVLPSEKASTEVPTQPSSQSGQTTPPTFLVERFCKCAEPNPQAILLINPLEIRLWCVRCGASLLYVRTTAPAAPETG